MDEQMKLKKASYHLWTFVTSKFISAFGSQVYAFAISLYILQLTGSATNFAINLISNILPRTIIPPFVGYLVDNYSRKKNRDYLTNHNNPFNRMSTDRQSDLRLVITCHLYNNMYFVSNIHLF